jgi:hypothetical protein
MNRLTLVTVLVAFLVAVAASPLTAQDRKVIDEKELKEKQIDITKLADDQLIRVEGKVISVGEVKANAAKAAKAMAAAETKLATQAAARFQEYEQALEREVLQQQRVVAAQHLKVINDTYGVLDPNTIPAPENDPVVSKLSVNNGQPGDPILITGTDFGAQRGWVRIHVAEAQPKPAEVQEWTPTQILASVPDVSGIPDSYNGVLRVETPAGRQSNMVSFRFDPAMEVRIFPPWYQNTYRKCDAWFPGTEAGLYTNWTADAITVGHSHVWLAFGCSTDDEFHENVELMNNWTVEHVDFAAIASEGGEADASITHKYEGTSNPYVKVHYWVTAWDWVRYTLSVYVKGPKGCKYLEDET